MTLLGEGHSKYTVTQNHGKTVRFASNRRDWINVKIVKITPASTTLTQQCSAVTCLSAYTLRAVLNIAMLASALMMVLSQALLTDM